MGSVVKGPRRWLCHEVGSRPHHPSPQYLALGPGNRARLVLQPGQPQESLCSVLGGLLGGGVCGRRSELQNQTPGSAGSECHVLASLTPPLDARHLLSKAQYSSVHDVQKQAAHTLVWLGPQPCSPAQASVGNVGGPAPGRDGRAPETPPADPQRLALKAPRHPLHPQGTPAGSGAAAEGTDRDVRALAPVAQGWLAQAPKGQGSRGRRAGAGLGCGSLPTSGWGSCGRHSRGVSFTSCFSPSLPPTV